MIRRGAGPSNRGWIRSGCTTAVPRWAPDPLPCASVTTVRPRTALGRTVSRRFIFRVPGRSQGDRELAHPEFLSPLAARRTIIRCRCTRIAVRQYPHQAVNPLLDEFIHSLSLCEPRVRRWRRSQTVARDLHTVWRNSALGNSSIHKVCGQNVNSSACSVENLVDTVWSMFHRFITCASD